MGITDPPTPRRLLSPSAIRVFIVINVIWLAVTLLMIFAKPAGSHLFRTVTWRMHLTDIAIAQGSTFILLNLIGWFVNMMLIHFPRQMLKMIQPLLWISIAIQLFLFIVNHVLRL